MATSVTTTHHTLADSSHDHGHHSHDHPCHDHDHYHHIPLEVGVGPLKFDAPLSVASKLVNSMNTLDSSRKLVLDLSYNAHSGLRSHVLSDIVE